MIPVIAGQVSSGRERMGATFSGGLGFASQDPVRALSGRDHLMIGLPGVASMRGLRADVDGGEIGRQCAVGPS